MHSVDMKLLTDKTVTGLLYLGLAVTGLFVFLFARSNIFIDGNTQATIANLVQKETLARFGIAAELLLVMFQALAAVWFYKLFSKVDHFAAGLIGVFGMVNAITILISAAMWLSALNASLANNPAVTVFQLFQLHESIWLVSGIFFGLWLIPMGYLSFKAKISNILGWLLILGGIGYILSTLILVLLPSQKSIAEVLPLFATVGEFWMIGYLLFKPAKK